MSLIFLSSTYKLVMDPSRDKDFYLDVNVGDEIKLKFDEVRIDGHFTHTWDVLSNSCANLLWVDSISHERNDDL